MRGKLYTVSIMGYFPTPNTLWPRKISHNDECVLFSDKSAKLDGTGNIFFF